MILPATTDRFFVSPLLREEAQRMLDQAAADAEGFEYAIAHDLRTPLRAVAASASILLEELGPSLGCEHRGLLERQAQNAVRFGRLIDDLLELSRLNRAVPRRRPVDLSGLVRRLGASVDISPDLTVSTLR